MIKHITPEQDDFELEDPFTPLEALSKDLLVAAAKLSNREVRFLVDAYYSFQENRKRGVNRINAMGNQEPNQVFDWVVNQELAFEKRVLRALDAWTDSQPIGQWLRSVKGIGPVIAAGLVSHVYMGHWCTICHGRDEKDHNRLIAKLKLPEHPFEPIISCPTAGHIWQFAGIAGDGQRPWEKGKRRPHNAKLKTLCWKIGQSFMKLSNNADCVYGRLYKQRKAIEQQKNDRGEFAAQAAVGAARVGRATEAFKYYSAGKLPPAHIDARARRWAVKIFLSHFHQEYYRQVFNEEPPAPFPIAILGHAHRI